MMDSFFWWIGAIVSTAFMVVVVGFALGFLADFVSKSFAIWRLIKKGRMQVNKGWTPAKVAVYEAGRSFGEWPYNLHSNNAWLVSLEYSHPFKWRIVDHWDRIDGSEEDEE